MRVRLVILSLIAALSAAQALGLGEGNRLGRLGAIVSGFPSWVPNRNGILPDAAVNFALNQAWQKSGGLSSAASLLTTTRAAVNHTFDYANDSAGNWLPFAANVPRITDLGLLTEESRTNSIRNNSMQGAVVGTPGTPPTNWLAGATVFGLSRQIVGLGTESGIDYVDIRYSGTSTGGTFTIEFDSQSAITVAQGQTWTSSAFITLVGGSLTNTSNWFMEASGYSSGPILSEQGLVSFTPAAGVLGLSRYQSTKTFLLANAITGNARIALMTAAGPVDFTLRIGWPQLENNNINSTVASAAMAASGAGGVNGSGVYSVGGGTGTAATLNVTWAAGVMTVNSVASAGSYTVFPPSPATLTYVSGTATGWTGATVTLTPTNNAASGFNTSPIRTTNAAVLRAVDVVTLTTPPVFGSAVTLYAKTERSNPLISFPWLLSATSSLNANKFVVLSSNTAANHRVGVKDTTTQWDVNAGGSIVIGTPTKWAMAVAASDFSSAYDGNAGATQASGTIPSGLDTVLFGSLAGGAGINSWNDFIAEAAIWASQRVPNAQLQSMTTP